MPALVRTEQFCNKATRIYKRYGLSYAEIAKRLNVSWTLVKALADSEGWSYTASVQKGFHKLWKFSEEQEAKRLYRKCHARKDVLERIAAKLGKAELEVVMVLLTNKVMPRNRCSEYEKRPFIWTRTAQLKAKRLHGLKWPMHDIAAELGTHSNKVAQYLASSESRIFVNDLFAHHKKDVMRLYTKEGQTIVQIAAQIGVSKSVVSLWLKKLGLNRNGARLSYGKLYQQLHSGKVRPEQWWEYSKTARTATETIYREFQELIDPEKQRSDAIHLDHMLSVYDAFCKYRTPVPVWVVAHPANLTLVSSEVNWSKQRSSSIRRKRLLKRIRRWETKHKVSIQQFLDAKFKEKPYVSNRS